MAGWWRPLPYQQLPCTVAAALTTSCLFMASKNVLEKTKKMVRFSDDPEAAQEGTIASASPPAHPTAPGDGAVRIKLVISRRELMGLMAEGLVRANKDCEIDHHSDDDC